MDYFKVKVAHVEDSELTDAEVGQLVRFQSKIAKFHRPLSEKEFNKTFSPKKLPKIIKFLEENDQINLEFIAEKVLEDVEKCLKKQKKNTEKVAKYRENLRLKQKNVPGVQNASCYRLEKRREEENIQKEQQAAQKESDVPPDAAAAFPKKFREGMTTIQNAFRDPGGHLPDEYKNQYTGPARCRRDCLDIAQSVVWVRGESGKKINDPVGLMKYLARQYEMSPEEFAEGMQEIADYESVLDEKRRKKAEAEQKAKSEAEADRQEEIAANRRRQVINDMMNLAPEVKDEIMRNALAALKVDFPVSQEPPINSPLYQKYIVKEYEKVTQNV